MYNLVLCIINWIERNLEIVWVDTIEKPEEMNTV
jgi:hypothetical protein